MNSQSLTQIPGDSPNRAKYFYHPKHDGAKRVDLKDKDIAEGEIRRLIAEGWSERRVAAMLYHAAMAPEGRVFRSNDEIAAAKKNGWKDEPISHTHAQDAHRLIHLQMQKAEEAEETDEDEDDAKEEAERLSKAQAKAAEKAAKDAEKAAKKAAKDAA